MAKAPTGGYTTLLILWGFTFCAHDETDLPHNATHMLSVMLGCVTQKLLHWAFFHIMCFSRLSHCTAFYNALQCSTTSQGIVYDCHLQLLCRRITVKRTLCTCT